MRFYEINSGKILLDGKNINSYKLNDLRQVITSLFEVSSIFNCSLTENILYGQKDDIKNSEVENALVAAGGSDIIESKLITKFKENIDEMIDDMRENRKEIKLMYGDKYYNERLMKLEEI